MATSLPPTPPPTGKFTGYAAMKPKGDLVPHDFEPAEWTPYSIQMDVMHCGLCQSDLHLNGGDWGPFSVYPQVSGHEIVGKVSHVGSALSDLKKGDVVGVGWQCGSCFSCEWCKTAKVNVCPKANFTAALGNKGGFANKWRGDGRHAYKLPENLNPKFAGPLMCGGLTVYSPLLQHTKPGDRVGIIGIGGLGSMAIQLASRRGCVVTAMSRGTGKKDLCMKLGATNFVDTKALAGTKEEQAAWVKDNADTFDFMIYTPSKSSDGMWGLLLHALRPYGKIVCVGTVSKPVSFPAFGPFIMKNLSVVGGNTGGSDDMSHMLQFAADQKINPMIEEFAMKDINDACKKLQAGTVRFRVVLNN